MAVKRKVASPSKASKAAKAAAGDAPRKPAAKAKAPKAPAKKVAKVAKAAKPAGTSTPRAPAGKRAGGSKPKGAKSAAPAEEVTSMAPAGMKAEPEPRPEAARVPVGGSEPDTEPDPTATAKLAIGPGAEARETPTQIPWSYGIDRVTAAAVDPEKLFVYWEVTDPAIERARAALGRGGPGAWLNLRVYDTTGLIFDGTNAHSYFDHAVDRTTRQWFFHIGKPTSTAFVELGMKSSEGYFARIVRSGRVDFPRREPAPWGDPEWMTVRPGVLVEEVHRAPAPAMAAAGGGGAAVHGNDGAGYWSVREAGGVHELVLRQLTEGGWERVEWSESGGEGWVALEGRVEWESPRVVSTWESGPFAYPVEIEPPRREERAGGSFAYRVGNVVHVVEGPWRVVIRNIGAHSERQVLGTWEIHRAWTALSGHAVRVGGGQAGAGASEVHWLAGSEYRLGGASERWRIGASEVAWRGASERMMAGASQWRYAGASERRYVGASETRLGGASERVRGGASESRLGGASERALGGGSERAQPAGSEGRLGASDLRFEGPTAPPLPYPHEEG